MQRVASKIGEQDITMFDTNNPYLKQANSKAAENTPATDFDTLKNKQIMDFSYYLSKNGSTTKNVKVNYTEYKKVDTNTETTSAKAAENTEQMMAAFAEIYYYHSDHLGTGTFLSDFDGNPYQFFLNLPFGETMAEQHSYSGDYTNRYKFNGKELDEETGFYYYGARYYNPKFSIWLSIDPLAEKFSGWNPYNFCLNNPIYFIDPDGMAAVPGDDTYIYKDAQGKVTKTEVINTGTDTPNRLFIQDASATKDTENRKEHNGSFFQIEMIPSNQYTEKDYKSGFFESSQFDKDRHAYITNGGDYSDKNYLQRLGTSLADDPVTISDLTVLLMPRGNAKGPGGALGAEEKAIQYTYAPRVRARGVEDPVSHNFPYSFDKHILQTPAISKNNGYNIYQLPGSMNGKNGVFEIGVNNKNIIDHRFFRPTK
jgi:RHS repeat-associated protein